MNLDEPMKIYDYYFPHNNYDKVIKRYQDIKDKKYKKWKKIKK